MALSGRRPRARASSLRISRRSCSRISAASACSQATSLRRSWRFRARAAEQPLTNSCPPRQAQRRITRLSTAPKRSSSLTWVTIGRSSLSLNRTPSISINYRHRMQLPLPMSGTKTSQLAFRHLSRPRAPLPEQMNKNRQWVPLTPLQRPSPSSASSANFRASLATLSKLPRLLRSTQ